MWLSLGLLVLFFAYSIVRDVRHSRELKRKDEIIGKQFDKLFEFGQDVVKVRSAVEENTIKTHQSIEVNKGLTEAIAKLLIRKKK